MAGEANHVLAGHIRAPAQTVAADRLAVWQDRAIDHILDDPIGLTARAQRFLRDHASRLLFDVPKGHADAALLWLREAQQRYGGLSFRHEGPGFRERLDFVPWLDDDGGDGAEPWVEFIEHTTAIPWAVLLRADGSVAFTVTGPGWTPEGLISVYPSADALIEDAALHTECAAWRWAREQSLTLAEAELVRDRAAGLRPIPEGAGLTQWWWEGDGFRIFLTVTVPRIYPAAGRCTMSLWAREEHAAHAAEAYLAQTPRRDRLGQEPRWSPRP